MREIKMTEEVKALMDSTELAAYLGYTQRTIYKLIKEDRLPAINIRGQFRFRKDVVDRWLEERMSQSEPETH